MNEKALEHFLRFVDIRFAYRKDKLAVRFFNIGVATRRAVRAEAYAIDDLDIDFDEAADPDVIVAEQE